MKEDTDVRVGQSVRVTKPTSVYNGFTGIVRNVNHHENKVSVDIDYTSATVHFSKNNLELVEPEKTESFPMKEEGAGWGSIDTEFQKDVHAVLKLILSGEMALDFHMMLRDLSKKHYDNMDDFYEDYGAFIEDLYYHINNYSYK